MPSLVATRLVAQWAAVHDLGDDGLLNGRPDLRAEVTRVPSREGRHAYTRTVRTAPDGRSVVESYLVRGMGHVWPGPNGIGRYTDHAGPDASAIAWDFAERHPRR